MRALVTVMILLGSLACSSEGRVTLEFRIAEEEPAPGLTEMVLAPGGQHLYLHASHPVSESDVDSAAVVLQGEKPSVALILSEEGARKFAELTKQNVHKRCAILVDGQIVSAPRIMAPIRTGRAIISGDFTESEARRIARGLSNP